MVAKAIQCHIHCSNYFSHILFLIVIIFFCSFLSFDGADIAENFLEKVNSFSIFAAKDSNFKLFENEAVSYPSPAGDKEQPAAEE